MLGDVCVFTELRCIAGVRFDVTNVGLSIQPYDCHDIELFTEAQPARLNIIELFSFYLTVVSLK